MKKVLIINTAASGGGAARMARALYDTLQAADGFQCRMAVGRGHIDDKGIFKVTTPIEIGAQWAVTRLTGLQGTSTPLGKRRLSRLIESWQPDIIHFHNIHGYYFDLKSLLEIRRNGWDGPIALTLHDAWTFTGRCAYFSNCRRWETGCGQCPDLRRYPKTYLDTSRFMWRKKQKVFAQLKRLTLISPSRWLKDCVATSFLSDFETRVLPNGVDTHFFRPRGEGREVRSKLGIARDLPAILFLANDLAVDRKGGYILNDLIRSLIPYNVSVITVGSTSKALPNGEHVHHLGHLRDAKRIAEIYDSVDIFCSTSLDDNFPTSNLEALSSGTPIVAFSVGGIPEQVTEQCGRLVSPGNVDGVLRELRKLCDDPSLREKLSRNARARAMNEFSLSRFKLRHIELYTELVNNGF